MTQKQLKTLLTLLPCHSLDCDVCEKRVKDAIKKINKHVAEVIGEIDNDWAHLLTPGQHTVWHENGKLKVAQGIHDVSVLRKRASL